MARRFAMRRLTLSCSRRSSSRPWPEAVRALASFGRRPSRRTRNRPSATSASPLSQHRGRGDAKRRKKWPSAEEPRTFSGPGRARVRRWRPGAIRRSHCPRVRRFVTRNSGVSREGRLRIRARRGASGAGALRRLANGARSSGHCRVARVWAHGGPRTRKLVCTAADDNAFEPELRFAARD